MKTLDAELKEVTARVRDVDGKVAEKQEAYDKMLDEARASGTSLADLAADKRDELIASGRELDGLKDDQIKLRDLQQSLMSRIGGSDDGRAGSIGDLASLFTGYKIGTLADAILRHPAYASLTPDALMGNGAIGSALPGIEVLNRDALVRSFKSGRSWFNAAQMFAAATADLDAGIPLDQRLYPPIEILRRQIRLLDLITIGATNVEAVVFAQQTVRTSAAAETALGTAYGEATFDFEKVTANVQSIGHFTTAYRENIADAAQFETIIENQLQEDVMLRLESQILAGDGTGNNLPGILHTSGVQSVTRDTTNERRVEAIHRAITEVRLAFREPSAILLHPNDYQETLFEKAGADSSGNYVWLGALQGLQGDTPATLWGKPVVVSPVAVEGTGVVAYWKDATLWQRSGVSIRISDSHSDYFTKRQVAILADMRGAFSVQRPGAFCEVLAL